MSEIELSDNAHLDHAEIVLRNLGLKKDDPAAMTLVALAQRYHLDPLLRHIVLIPQRDKTTKQIKHYNPYVTRDGLLHIAHRSGKLTGIVLESLEETDTHYVAWVSVYRRDFTHPVRYRGKYPKDPANAPHMKPYAEEMAIKCAEAMALRRAFDVAAPIYEEIYELHEDPEIVQSMQVIDHKVLSKSSPSDVNGAATEESAPEPADAKEPTEPAAEVAISEEPPKRRRGRPRKTEVTTEAATIENQAPRRRGRPRKTEAVAPQPHPAPEPQPTLQEKAEDNGQGTTADEEPPPMVGLVAYFNESPVHLRPYMVREMRAHGYNYFGGLPESATEKVAEIFSNIYSPEEYKRDVGERYNLDLTDLPNDPVELGLTVWKAGYGR